MPDDEYIQPKAGTRRSLVLEKKDSTLSMEVSQIERISLPCLVDIGAVVGAGKGKDTPIHASACNE